MDKQTIGQKNDVFKQWADEISRENRRAVRLLWLSLVPFGVLNLLVQALSETPTITLQHSALMFLYALAVALLEGRVLPQEMKHATALMYLLCTPAFLLAALFGTVWDPERQAITILLFMMVLPLLVLDRMTRLAGVTALWLAMFLLLSHAYKPVALFRADLLHGIEFYLAALVVYAIMSQLRLKYIRNLKTVAYERDHDRVLDCLNRKALYTRLSGCVGRPLVMLNASLEQAQLYRDYFGPALADAMIVFFYRALADEFGAETVFRYTETEFVCLGPGEDAKAYLEKLERCRDRLRGFQWDGSSFAVSMAAGYVTATPNAEQTTLNMLRLANIYAHQARRRGHDQTIGGVYGEGALSQGIHQSALLAEDAEHENNRITGLPELSFFVSHADVLLANVVDPMLEPMVGYLKLQHLRDYNNRYGYEKGDALLVKTAELLRRAFPDRYCCHITGGQFCVLCYRDEAEAGLTMIREGQRSLGEKFDVACLAGFAPYTGSESAISLLDRARNAYDSIRSSKKHFMRIFDSKLGEELRFKEYIASHIDEAIESGWLMVYYQPIIRSITSEVCNEEALCRWNDPQYGLLAPGRFIPVLEERGLLYKADLFVVRQVLREFDERRALGVPIVPVSVNLSRRDFEERDMVKEITALLDEAHCDRSLIKIEITESAFVTDQDMLKTEMRRFHAAGFDIWMDDFGSEYSTLNLLRELDFDLIKIDMKFMENFTPDGRNYIIVSKIIDMARELGISTLIEGVETKDQLRMMQILGCEKIQGYLFNSPHPLSYIAQRAQTGTGLHFEKTASAPYYGMVGRVNLNEPMASADGKKHLLAADVMPAGVVELRDGRVFCLRGTNAFLRRLEQWKILSAAEDDTQIREVTLPSKKWQEMMEQSLETEEWVSMTTKTSFGRSVVIYVRRLGDASWQGALAMLVVLLPEVEL